MNLDIHTLAMILGITHFIQVIVFVHQYKVNRTYQGIGWWLMWSAAEASGFFFMLLRNIPAISAIAILAQNFLLVSGTIFLYIGIMRFLEQRENRRILVSIFAVFVVAHSYFIFVDNNINIRGIILSATLASVSFLTARALYVHKIRCITASANFNAAVFLAHGLIFIHRTVFLIAGTHADDFFAATLFNTIPFLDALIVSLLWTFGLIIMLNQRLNAEMAEAKEHFELIFNTGPDGAVITRLDDGVVLNINDGYTALTGYTRDDSIGKSSLDIKLWKNSDDRGKIVTILREKGYCDNFESVFLRKDGSQIIGLMSAKIITLQSGPHIISVTRDISEYKKAEAEIIKLNAELELRVLERTFQLENFNKEFEDFAYSIAHDLRSPLRAVHGFSRIIMDEYGSKLDTEGNRLLNVISDNVRHMDRLISDLLELSQVTRGEMVLSLIDMTGLAESVYREIASPDVQERFEFSVMPLPTVQGDSGLLRQVWTNLLSNAVKYTMPRDVRRIEVGGYTEKKVNIYFVQDSGIGFEPEYAHKLFGVFQRLHALDEFEGTGIGLAIVKRIIHRHGGMVWAEGKQGEGAKFYFSLPVAEGD
jgi:PAS domain S-box-containing protein